IGDAGAAKAAPAAPAAAEADPDIGLGAVAFLHSLLLGGAHIGDGEHHVGGAGLDIDAGNQRTAAAADEPAQDAADIGAAGIGVFAHHIRHQDIVGRANLSAADIGALLQLPAR